MNRLLRRALALALVIAFFGVALILIAGSGPVARAQSNPATSSWGFNPANLDKNCKPCDDFYEFAMGGWMKNNPIPPEYPQWGSFSQLADRNRTELRTVLEAAAKANAPSGTDQQKIGDLYTSCMDTAAIDSAGLKPLDPELSQIAAIKGVADLQPVVAELQRRDVNVIFRFGSMQDFDDSSKVIARLGQGGLGLPDRDYYARDDEKSKQLRADYLDHVQKMFALAGDSLETSKAEAQTVMSVETALAKASLTRVESRDPEKTWHKMSIPQLREVAPDWSWEAYFRDMGAPGISETNVTAPAFFKEVNRELAATPIADWKIYLRWHLIHTSAPALPEAFVQEDFNFFGKRLNGSKEIQPRWKRCVLSVDGNLGEALGKVYVEKYFPPDAKAHAQAMVQNLIAALNADIPTLSWMSDATKKAAIEKLQAFTVKIGYPDKWRDYSRLSINRQGYLPNLMRSAEFETAYDLDKIGKPVDRTEWGMTPPTVNAYYRPTMNEIVFPAGILQPPFYDPKADDAINYGGMGAVIGHEISHGFDDQGAKFDGKGNKRDWWTPSDKKNFDEHTSCVEKQFDGYEVEPGLHENGKLVLGESIADLGGLAISYAAYEKSMEGKPRKVIDGFTPEQRFFLGWAQVWGANTRPEYARLMVNTNPHPLPNFRANGPLSNMEAFAKAFGCTKGDKMVRENVCKIW